MNPEQFRDLWAHFDRLFELPPDAPTDSVNELASAQTALASELARMT